MSATKVNLWFNRETDKARRLPREMTLAELSEEEIAAVNKTGMVLVSTIGRPCPIAITATMDA